MASYNFYNPAESFQRLVLDIRFINHQWHGLENIPGAEGVCEGLRAMKDMRQLRLIRYHRELISLKRSEEKINTFLIELKERVNGYSDAAHIPIHKVPRELWPATDSPETNP